LLLVSRLLSRQSKGAGLGSCGLHLLDTLLTALSSRLQLVFDLAFKSVSMLSLGLIEGGDASLNSLVESLGLLMSLLMHPRHASHFVNYLILRIIKLLHFLFFAVDGSLGGKLVVHLGLLLDLSH